MSAQDYAEISSLMQAYADGLYHADSQALRQVFHPNLAYVCATPGDELHLDLEAYMARIDKRTPPSETGDARDDRVLEIKLATPQLAHVTASMALMGRTYLDLLTLQRTPEGWRIVTKVFSYVPMEKS